MLLKKHPLPHEIVTLHSSMPELLFRHRRTLSKKFRDVLGTYEIDHISIDIINPKVEMISFSSTPTMLYNLITSDLFPYDGTLSPSYFKKLSFFLWQDTYPQEHIESLKLLKESHHNLHQGFTLVRHINSFYILYSFATKNKVSEWKPYNKHINELLKIGDYCYKSIKKLSAPLCKPYVPPMIEVFIPYEKGEPKDVGQRTTNRHLNLIINH